MKKIWDELKSQNIFYYIIVFSIIVILIITSLGSYLYQFYYKTIYSDFLISNEEHLDAEINRHENDMQIIRNIVYQMGITEDVTKFRLSENPAGGSPAGEAPVSIYNGKPVFSDAALPVS